MSLTFFDLAALPATPWKNGGGSTREIVCQPPGAGMDSFDWRVSIATIASAGPFSVFPGVDRVIMLLEGDGVHLRGDGVDHRLDTPLAPFPFAGDVALDCALLGRTSSDFNVMTRRGTLRADVRVLRVATDLAAVERGLLLALGGAWQFDGAGAALRCEAGTGVWWQGRAYGGYVAPQQPGAVLVVVQLHRA